MLTVMQHYVEQQLHGCEVTYCCTILYLHHFQTTSSYSHSHSCSFQRTSSQILCQWHSFRLDYNRYSVTRLFSNKPTKQSPRSCRVFLMVQLICDEALCQWMMSNSQHSERIIILQNVGKWRKPFS
jgi:hypothetical protein